MTTSNPNRGQGPGFPQTPGSEPEEETSAARQPEAAGGTAAASQGLASRQPAQSEIVRKPELGQTLVIAAGVLMFIWGFLPWYSDPGGSANAWSTATIPGLVLTATWVPLLSLAIAVLLAIKAFGGGLPDRVGGFSWAQLAVMIGIFNVLITFGFLVANRSLGSFGTLSLGAGLILSFITSLVMLAGAILDHAGSRR